MNLSVQMNGPRGRSKQQEATEDSGFLVLILTLILIRGGLKMETIDMTPTWQETAVMLTQILESGSDKSWARDEIIRMGKIIDQQQALIKQSKEVA